jgi:ABC-2 type transport system permease protein
MFLGSVASESLYAIVGNSNVVKKVWMPTEAFPTATVLGHLIHLLLAFAVLFVFIAAYAIFGTVPEGYENTGERLGWLVVPGWEILLLPVLLALQAALLFGIALILSSLNVFYRDMASITEIALSAWFYLTPIIYPANEAREQFKAMGFEAAYWIWLCNPMTSISLAYRRVFYGPLFRHAPEVSDTTLLFALGVTALTTIVVVGFGMWLFRRQSARFADEL